MEKQTLVKLLGLTALVGSLGASPADALARPGHGMHGGDPGARIERVLGSLDLSEEQRARIDAIRAELRADLRELKGDDDRRPGAMMDILTAEQIDREQVRREMAERSARRQQVAARVTDALFEIREVLTPEQRRELAQTLEARRAARGGRRGGPPATE